MSANPPQAGGPDCAAAVPRAVFKLAEETLLRRRTLPPDMRGAVAAALAQAAGGAVPAQAAAAGQVIADAVAAFAASFGPAGEPAYHNQYHQAEATLAMGWLCAVACRLGLLGSEAAAAGVLAMAGHDLQHDGSVPPPGALEAHSAGLTVALAAQAGLDEAMQATISRVILATDPRRGPAMQVPARQVGDDLLCRLVREADLFGSLMPGLGWQLSQDLAQELRVARCHPTTPVDSYAGRLQLLSTLPSVSRPARELGLEDAVACQIAALAALGDGDAVRGAAVLDASPPATARAKYMAALAAVAGP
ncbi:MAG TPA: hypothetical protein VL356_06110 [Acidocella sp.]|nr:hypothetical protein [Acidocella sp.]